MHLIARVTGLQSRLISAALTWHLSERGGWRIYDNDSTPITDSARHSSVLLWQ